MAEENKVNTSESNNKVGILQPFGGFGPEDQTEILRSSLPDAEGDQGADAVGLPLFPGGSSHQQKKAPEEIAPKVQLVETEKIKEDVETKLKLFESDFLESAPEPETNLFGQAVELPTAKITSDVSPFSGLPDTFGAFANPFKGLSFDSKPVFSPPTFASALPPLSSPSTPITTLPPLAPPPSIPENPILTELSSPVPAPTPATPPPSGGGGGGGGGGAPTGSFTANFDPSTPDITIFGVNNFDGLGRSVNIIGDVNGDGFDDFAVGVPSGDVGPNSPGLVHVIFGSGTRLSGTFDVTTINGTNGVTIEGGQNFGSLRTVGKAGDFNGDGFEDLLISAPYATAGSRDGETYVIFGGPGFPSSATFAVTSINGTNGIAIDADGPPPEEAFGYAIDYIGDFNGDGFDDLILASPFEAGQYGGSRVVFGSASHTGATQANPLDVAVIGAADGFSFETGLLPTKHDFGYTATSAGDFNGDGYDDFMIGAARTSVAGSVHLVFGTATPPAAPIDLTYLTGAGTGFTITTGTVGDKLGFKADLIGDINADGIEDIAISAEEANGGNGAVYVLFGSKTAWTAATFDPSTLDGTNGFIVTSDGSANLNGFAKFISRAGDLNGDGIDDFVIGSPNGAPTTGTTSTGHVTIISGRSTAFPGTVTVETDISAAQGTGDTFFGTVSGENLNRVGGNGDIDGDGVDDLLVGSPSGGTSNAGVTYIWYGVPTTDVTPGATSGNDTLTGNIVHGAQGNDTLTGSGSDTVLLGGAGDDTLIASNPADIRRIDGGQGNDTFQLSSGSLNLNDMSGTIIRDIETIELTGGGGVAQTIKLNVNDILDMSSANKALIIVGDANDTLDLDGLASFTGPSAIGLFDQYTLNNATLLVHQDVTVVDL